MPFQHGVSFAQGLAGALDQVSNYIDQRRRQTQQQQQLKQLDAAYTSAFGASQQPQAPGVGVGQSTPDFNFQTPQLPSLFKAQEAATIPGISTPTPSQFFNLNDPNATPEKAFELAAHLAGQTNTMRNEQQRLQMEKQRMAEPTTHFWEDASGHWRQQYSKQGGAIGKPELVQEKTEPQNPNLWTPQMNLVKGAQGNPLAKQILQEEADIAAGKAQAVSNIAQKKDVTAEDRKRAEELGKKNVELGTAKVSAQAIADQLKAEGWIQKVDHPMFPGKIIESPDSAQVAGWQRTIDLQYKKNLNELNTIRRKLHEPEYDEQGNPIEAPKEIKGGKPSSFLMVPGVGRVKITHTA